MKKSSKRILLTFRTLTEFDFPALYDCFCESFSDYQISMKLSKVDFLERMNRIGYSPRLSGGAFEEEQMVGFIITGVGSFENKSTTYNGGTGVIPTFRKKKVAEKLYSFLISEFQKEGVEQALLEVISDNKPAIELYKKLGFKISRTLSCFSLSNEFEQRKSKLSIRISQVDLPDWKTYRKFYSDWVCWQNQAESITRSLRNEIVLEVYLKTKTIGFAIFNPTSGKISQIAISENHRNSLVAHNLLRAIQKMSYTERVGMLNVDEENKTAMHFFEQVGFAVFIRQYEMKLELGNYITANSE
ncbi:MAG: ribosomal protein S18 acetylase RimI-like enzyme [Arenicella sp.]